MSRFKSLKVLAPKGGASYHLFLFTSTALSQREEIGNNRKTHWQVVGVLTFKCAIRGPLTAKSGRAGFTLNLDAPADILVREFCINSAAPVA
jgi:hypothetical protein